MGATHFKEGHPTTWGGVIKDSSKIDKTFISHTMPDVAHNTRVIAVCGILEKDASPVNDGWFLSDFYLFNHLLRGEGSEQSWLSVKGTEPSTLMKKFGKQFPPGYLHGDPTQTRKVVLSRELVAAKAITHVRTFASSELLSKFLEVLKAQCDKARQSSQPVLILVFGHGNYDDCGIHIGEPIGPFIDRPQLLNFKNLKAAIGENVKVTLLSTSCYSGGWSITPDLNITTLTAAGPMTKSESWGGSASLGRKCGSIFASAVQQTLCSESSPLLQDNPARIPRNLQPAQMESYAELTRVIHAVLFKRVDRYAYLHGIKFSAQEDDWEMAWSKRTGIPLSNFQQKMDNLLDYAPQPEGPLGNVSSRNPDEPYEVDPDAAKSHLRQTLGYGEFIDWRELRGAFGGTVQTWKNYVTVLAKDYMGSFPGADNEGPNTGVHGRISSLLNDTGEISANQLRDLQYLIGYRSSLMVTAEDYLACADIPLPGGKRGHDFNERAWLEWAQARTLMQKYEQIFNVVRTAGLFPLPTSEQGPSWPKPVIYITAALVLANPPSPNAVKSKIEIMHKVKDETIKNDVAAAIKSSSIREYGKRWFSSIGATLRR